MFQIGIKVCKFCGITTKVIGDGISFYICSSCLMNRTPKEPKHCRIIINLNHLIESIDKKKNLVKTSIKRKNYDKILKRVINLRIDIQKLIEEDKM